MSVPSGIIVGYLRGFGDGVLGRVVKSRGWRMAHGGGSVGMCSRWSGDECRNCVGTCGYELPFCSLDVPGSIVCLDFDAIVVTELVQLSY